MASTSQRPLSPHVMHYRWGAPMAVSILHRVTGDILGTLGALTLTAWLVSAAMGAEAYQTFMGWMGTIWGQGLLIALTWVVFQHTASGLRHLLLDTGAGYELKRNRGWSWVVALSGIFMTAAVWIPIYMGRI